MIAGSGLGCARFGLPQALGMVAPSSAFEGPATTITSDAKAPVLTHLSKTKKCTNVQGLMTDNNISYYYVRTYMCTTLIGSSFGFGWHDRVPRRNLLCGHGIGYVLLVRADEYWNAPQLIFTQEAVLAPSVLMEGLAHIFKYTWEECTWRI
eukprot:1495608-Amphidinium_carterae.1